MENPLAVSSSALAAYFLNILDGKSMREIGKLQNCQASTVLRRIRKCEDLREHPEWDALFSALEDHQARINNSISAHLSRATVLAALNLEAADLVREFSSLLHLFQQPDSLLLVGDMPSAAVTIAGKVQGKMHRTEALAGLAFGWLVPVGVLGGKVRQFKPAPAAIECTGQKITTARPTKSKKHASAIAWRSSPLEHLFRCNHGLITAEHLRIAKDFQMTYLGRLDVTADVYSSVRRCLAPRLLTALEEVCGKSTGFEALEKSLRLPARSGKAVVVLALETLDHTRALT